MKLFAVVLLLLSTAFVFAQTPSEQALGKKLMAEINEGLTCNTNLVAAQAELVKAQARIKELEDKYESKK